MEDYHFTYFLYYLATTVPKNFEQYLRKGVKNIVDSMTGQSPKLGKKDVKNELKQFGEKFGKKDMINIQE